MILIENSLKILSELTKSTTSIRLIIIISNRLVGLPNRKKLKKINKIKRIKDVSVQKYNAIKSIVSVLVNRKNVMNFVSAKVVKMEKITPNIFSKKERILEKLKSK